MSSHYLLRSINFYLLLLCYFKVSNGCHFGCDCRVQRDMECVGPLISNMPIVPDNVTTLNIQRATLTSLNKEDFAGDNYDRLRTLRLQYDNIKHIGNNAFEEMKHLRHLFLDRNHLKYFSETTVTKHSNISVLGIGNNYFEYIPTMFICRLNNLRSLFINMNPLKKVEFSDQCYTDLYKLSEVSVAGTNLSRLHDNSFSALRYLYKLSLCNGSVSHIPLLLFKNMTNLRSLDLSMNRLQKISMNIFKSLTMLKHLNLSENRFISFVFDALPSNLQSLTLGSPHLSFYNLSFSSTLTNLSSLKLFSIATDSLSKNTFIQFNESEKITEFKLLNSLLKHIEEGAFSPFIALRNFSLNNNYLRDSSLASILKDLSASTQRIELINNRLDTLPFNSFMTLRNSSNIVVLDISRNSISGKLPTLTLKPLSNLQNLKMSRNGITGVTEVRGNLVSIKYLDLSHNNIIIIKKTLFCTFPNLLTLDLSYNDIAYFVSGSVHKCTKYIQSLKLVGTHINTMKNLDVFPNLRSLDMTAINIYNKQELKFKYNHKLETLILRSTQMTELNNDMFRNLTNLHKLSLNRNFLRNLNSSSFISLSNLLTLDLSFNQLLTLNMPLLYNLHSLIYLRLQSNTLHCSCDLMKLKTFLQHRNVFVDKIFEHNAVTCQLDSGKHINLIDFQISSFECKEYSYIIKVVATYTIFCLFTCFISLVYRYRWYLKYELYLLRTKVYRYKEVDQSQNFLFDAFVSFSEKDCQWVMRDLVTEVEHQHKLKLCLYNRNWLAGHLVVSYIAESIAKSRRVIFVITNNWIKSHWCKDELQLTRYRYNILL